MTKHKKIQIKLSLTGFFLLVFALAVIFFGGGRLLASEREHEDCPQAPEAPVVFASIAFFAVVIYMTSRRRK